ncbi:MAG: preprotein translocase subunit SecA [Deltaproteobacteria bacterium CG11_big_fil_rev_8_21_14_0_20_47_16]|nr:MAG: preprotein translocase subunit SecA [Deltaproteobacteria bacterium CG11_big_fil_rev_8_21_14_0_20_47_16]
MFDFILKKIVGTQNDRELKSMQPRVDAINAMEATVQKLTDSELQAKTAEFRDRLAKGATLDDILVEAFAVCREASRRVLGMRHFDVQLIGGMVLHSGKIAEMKTGEGKTLVATLPVYLNALAGNGVHVVTVNDYLARRDSEWMGRLYKFLGLTVGLIVHGLNDVERKASYGADITYGTNNEFGFDYLRDNMKFRLEDYVQRPLSFAIVDEVDSILIDEARTPLIISGPAEESTQLYHTVNQVVPFFKKDTDYTVDEKARTVVLTEAGVANAERRLSVENLFDPHNISILHHVNQALKAHVLFQRDVDYVVKDGQIIIVDEFTGRLMQGRRWSDGLHQAVEAKEGVRIENENQTLATVTFQNYFRMYKKLSGMTGTADTEAPEFAKIYNLEVVVIPTNRPMARKDLHDVIYKTEAAKFNAVVEEVKELYAKGQPVLVGTISIEKSEHLSRMLKAANIPHAVLNAKHHEKEAEIVAQAGRYRAVTISTNMAGRGTDIVLGGNPEMMALTRAGGEVESDEYKQFLEEARVKCAEDREKVLAAGGFHILGTERHESRRIDNQLRGRSGRQGDPGSSRFYLSLEDDLMRIFGGSRIKGMMEKLGMKEDEVIEHPWINRAVANAQKKVEEHNFSIRKNVIEYDDIMNQQRHIIYGKRRTILTAADTHDEAMDMMDSVVTQVVDEMVPDRIQGDNFDSVPFREKVLQAFDLKLPESFVTAGETREDVGQKLFNAVTEEYAKKEVEYGREIMTQVERYIMLQTLDGLWKDHLLQMDHLKEGIGLRGYGQKDPLVEYKKEGFSAFQWMMQQMAADVVEKLTRVQIQRNDIPQVEATAAQTTESHGAAPRAAANPFAAGVSAGKQVPKVAHVGRNDPCPCGSGKKYKKCCGA